jgi:hypothetical protein
MTEFPCTFAELFDAEVARGFARTLIEKLTFDQLVGMSDPKRITRSATVRVPPLKLDTYKDREAYYFNAKSAPSTTGLRHKGYIKVFKPKNPNTPLEKCECMVDCQCPDYKYRFAWANKQRGSSAVGPGSLNQAWNQAPRRTNPRGRPGLCKHILATRDWIYGQFRSFASDQVAGTTTDKLDRLVTQSQKRWADYPGEMSKARERDQKIKQSIERAAQLKAQATKDQAVAKFGPADQWKAASAKGAKATTPTPVPVPATPLAKTAGAKEVGINPAAAGSEVAARRAGDEPVAQWRARRSQESVGRSMTLELDRAVALQEELDAHLGQKGRAPGDEESEELKMLRQIRDICRHLAGDDLPPDLAQDDDVLPATEPGIPTDAAQASEQN